MQKRTFVVSAISFMLVTGPAAATGLLFDNYPINGGINGFQVNGTFSVSDSFTLDADATVTGVMFGAWLDPGDSLTAVSWSIGTSPFSVSSGLGVATTTGTFDLSNPDGYDVDSESFAIPNLPLSTGTYYLTISDALTAAANPVFWDINDGPGIDAWASAYGDVSAPNECFNVIGISGTCASSFEIVGTAAAPEPSSWALFGAGILIAAALRRSLSYR